MRSLLFSLFILIVGSCTTPEADGLVIKTVKEGSGIEVSNGNVIWIEETTTYSDGTLIFSTDQIGGPLKFEVGANQVIKGVDLGVVGMKVGEVRELIVPPALSIRTQYPPNISPDSTLYYSIELVKIEE